LIHVERFLNEPSPPIAQSYPRPVLTVLTTATSYRAKRPLSHPAAGRRSLRDVPANKRRVKLPEELLETPLPKELQETLEDAHYRTLWNARLARSEARSQPRMN